MLGKGKSEKKQHIQVFTRVRPLSAQEHRSHVVVQCINSKEVSVKERNQTKTFTFDQVFGPDSKQIDVYKVVVSPLISEVLQGYNCTVFAYGQTGTGKTFTMVGGKSDSCESCWEDDPKCGVIPRTLSHLFDELKVRADEFTVRVSFLELYNEELCDLLAPNDNDDGKNLKLFEDSMKKGSVIVSGLEERTVHNKDDVYALLEAGNLRRQTATTLMNAQSSRSHTIFTITVHIKVTTPEGEDLIKTGKMNLVDLAGSENIGRSGAVEMRAREAGNINQSLLTLGRVITSLVERTPHIPYRESKLTRILQDSLGGKTKTSIIATVSPALCNIEETLSTFDYAHRARNITNKPEINQKTSKRVLLKEYTEEIERLRRDLLATREKHGVYLASENYNAIMAERENLNKELISKLQLLKVRENELTKQEEILKSLNMDLFTTQSELAATCEKLREAKKLCTEKEDMLHELGKQTNDLIKTTDEAVNDAKTLHDHLDKSRQILEHNFDSAIKFKNNFCWHLHNMKSRTKDFLEKGIVEVERQIDAEKQFVNNIIGNQLALKEMTSKIVKETSDQIQSTLEIIANQTVLNQNFLLDQLGVLQSVVDVQNQQAHRIISELSKYSKKIKSDLMVLFEHFERNKNNLERQKKNMKVVQDRLIELTKLVLALPAVYREKLRSKEESLKCYAEEWETLESKQLSVRKQIEEAGHTLCRLAQEQVMLLRSESECKRAIKKVQNSRLCEKENFYKDIYKTLEGNLKNICFQAEKTEKINKVIKEAAADVKNSNETINPLFNSLSTVEEQYSTTLEYLISDQNLENRKKLISVREQVESKSPKISSDSSLAEKKSSDILAALKVYGNLIESTIEQQRNSTTTNIQAILSCKRNLYSAITKHSEELFADIHNRKTEIENFFLEDIRNYKKTGNTPQRKEFRYPRRIIGFSFKGDKGKMLEVTCNDRLGKKVRVKCNPDDTIGDLKKLIAAQTGTRWEKIVLKKWYTIFKDHIKLQDYEIHDGMNLELYYQ